MSTMMRFGLAVGAVAVTVGIAQVARDRSPASPGDRQGKAFRTPADTSQPVVRQQPVRVDTFYVQRVAGGSGLGSPGDLLITFQGQGFTLSARAPRLVLAGDFALEATEVNRDGTELYVLVPRDQMPRIATLRFDSVVVANPGARSDTEFARRPVRASAARLLRPDRDAPAVRLVYRDGAFSRESVRQ